MSKKIILFKNKSIKKLVFKKSLESGRNFSGKITVRGHGGSKSKKLLRLIDSRKYLWNIVGFVIRVEKNPYSNSFLALVSYTNYIFTYVICPNKVLPGDYILTGESVELNPGNSTLVKNVAINEKVFNIEKYPFLGAVYAKSAGSYGIIKERKNKKTCILLPSKRRVWVSNDCMVTLGEPSNNKDRYKIKYKAGYNRLQGFRPKVRGVAMNAVDHPHGGGKGKKSPNAVSSSPWKKLGKNIKTK